MELTEINVLEENVELDNPIFIEALPGLGHVGKLVVDHIIDEFEATKFAEIYSPTFPPQVIVKEDGLVENMIIELYYLKDVGEDNQDMLFLVGNTQPLDPEGQYYVFKDILDFIISSFDIKQICTLGGMAFPQILDEDKVWGAATNESYIEMLKELDIEIRSNDGGIVGASGLFLGLGHREGIDGFCLLGQTPGYYIDAKAAEDVLIKLSQVYNFEINTDKLEERAEETEKMIAQFQQMEESLSKAASGNPDDLRYIG